MFVSPKDQGSRREGYTDSRYSDLRSEEAFEGGPGSGPHRKDFHDASEKSKALRGVSSDLLHKIAKTGVGQRGNNVDVYPEDARRELSRRGKSQESAPPGWEGTVKAMKKHKDIDNPFALAWSMKNKGDTPHKKESAEGGPGSGRHKGDHTNSIRQAQQNHIDRKTAAGHKLVGRGKFPNGTPYHDLKSPSGKVTQYVTFGPGHAWGGEGAKVMRAHESRRSLESRRGEDDPNVEAHNMMGDFLNAQGRPQKVTPGWKNSNVYTPPPARRVAAPNVVIKEF